MNEQVPSGAEYLKVQIGGHGGLSPGPDRKYRSSHTKSRTGCFTCRSRRVKCDEIRPICAKCSFRKIQCVYPSVEDLLVDVSKPLQQTVKPRTLAIVHPSEESLVLLGPTTKPSEIQILANPQALLSEQSATPGKRCYSEQFDSSSESGLGFLWSRQEAQNRPPNSFVHQAQQVQSDKSGSVATLVDLNLLSNFMTQTYATLSLLEGKQQVWKSAVIRLSSNSSCLMHGLLAVSALHKAHGEKVILARDNQGEVPETHDSFSNASSYIQAATAHHNLAVSYMRKEVASLAENNIQEVFATSTVLVAYSFATAHAGPVQDIPLLTWPNLEWFRLLRGISSITAQGWPALRMGPLRKLLDVRVIHEDWKRHLQGRTALHRDPSVPVQLPEPTYMQLKNLKLDEQHCGVPGFQAHASSSLNDRGSVEDRSASNAWSNLPHTISDHQILRQLTHFRLSAETAISALLKACNLEVDAAEKCKSKVGGTQSSLETASSDQRNQGGPEIQQNPNRTVHIVGIRDACLVLKDLYIRILLMFQYSSFCNISVGSKYDHETEVACNLALQEIEEVGALSWPAMVSEEYVRQLSQTLPNADFLQGNGLRLRASLRCQRSKALVVLAYYNVLLVLLESGFWWLHGNGRTGIVAIAKEVQESFDDAVRHQNSHGANSGIPFGDVDHGSGTELSGSNAWVELLEWPMKFVTSRASS